VLIGRSAAETTTPLVPLGEHVLRGIAAPCPSSPCRMRERVDAGDKAASLQMTLKEFLESAFSPPREHRPLLPL
jgi:hypothetical protein